MKRRRKPSLDLSRRELRKAEENLCKEVLLDPFHTQPANDVSVGPEVVKRLLSSREHPEYIKSLFARLDGLILENTHVLVEEWFRKVTDMLHSKDSAKVKLALSLLRPVVVAAIASGKYAGGIDELMDVETK